jgi:CBS domain-containing protein
MSEQQAARDILHLSSVINSPLVDRAGDRLGRVNDLIVRLGDGGYPPITGVLGSVGGRDVFVPIDMVAGIEPGSVRLAGERLSLQQFQRRPGEVLLAHDLAGRHVMNLVGARLVRANEIELARVDGHWVVAGVDPGSRPVLRRLLPRPLRQRIRARGILDWSSVEPFVGHVPTARLRIPYRKLARLKPAQIADLVEEASHEEGEEIIEAVGGDSELEADVFEELDAEHQLEFLASRSDTEAAALLGNMAPDDAADLLIQLDQDRRLPVLSLLPHVKQRKVRSLLSYNPETAGGLMSPDFLSVPSSTSVGDTLAEVETAQTPDELQVVFATDEDGRVAGSATVVHLLRADRAHRLADVVEPDPPRLHPDADVHQVLRTMADYNLTALAVVDGSDHVMGVITVDDVLELLLPAGWRREAGMAQGD